MYQYLVSVYLFTPIACCLPVNFKNFQPQVTGGLFSFPKFQSTMSTNASSASASPEVQALHQPEQAAHIEVPHLVDPMPQGFSGMSGKALLAKKMAASGYVHYLLSHQLASRRMLIDFPPLCRQSFYSPTDTLVSPCTQKLHLAKKKHHSKCDIRAISVEQSSDVASCFAQRQTAFPQQLVR